MSKGNPAAPVKIVEYADILCPFCAKANSEVIPKIESDYINKGKAHLEVRLVAMIAPDSQRAAEGAYCAAEQNKFWAYINTAYERTWNDYYSKNKSPEEVPLFSQSNIQSFAKSIPLDTLNWNDCMQSGRYKATLIENRKQLSDLDAFGTPDFVINKHNYSGAPPYASFKAVIDSDLGKQSS